MKSRTSSIRRTRRLSDQAVRRAVLRSRRRIRRSRRRRRRAPSLSAPCARSSRSLDLGVADLLAHRLGLLHEQRKHLRSSSRSPMVWRDRCARSTAATAAVSRASPPGMEKASRFRHSQNAMNSVSCRTLDAAIRLGPILWTTRLIREAQKMRRKFAQIASAVNLMFKVLRIGRMHVFFTRVCHYDTAGP